MMLLGVAQDLIVKRGRGPSKSKVIVGISLTDEGKPQFAKMKVVDSVLKDSAYKYSPEKLKYVNHTEVLHWLHIVISNAKAFINGTYHGLGCKHLQKYLDEYCYRFNRRFWENQLFDRLLRTCSTSKTLTYSELTL